MLVTPSRRTSSILLAVAFLIPGARPALADPAHIARTERTLLPSGDTVEHDSFGVAVAISGNTMVIGGFNADGAEVGAGAAFVFEKSGNTWVQTARLFAADGKAEPVANDPGKFRSDAFGSAVAISGDTVVVGAPQHTHPGLQKNAGAVYVFQRVDGEWVQQAELFSPTPFAEAFFGAEPGFGGLAISGGTIVVGDEGAFTVDVFTRDIGGWGAATQFTVPDDFAFVPSDVAIDGGTVVVGSPGSDAPGAFSAGAAYVFQRVGADWVQQAELTAADAAPGAQFGWTVRVDGHLVAVGANRAPGASDLSGAAYVFAERGEDGWSPQAKLQAADGVDGDNFGSAISLSGHTVLVGAQNRAPVSGLEAGGTAYVFRAREGGWPEIAELTASDGIPQGDFGVAVAVQNEVLLVGADGQHPPVEGYAGGEAYVFRLDP
jgi:FG-GAP repeat protein